MRVGIEEGSARAEAGRCSGAGERRRSPGREQKEGGVALVSELENQEPLETAETESDDSAAPEVSPTTEGGAGAAVSEPSETAVEAPASESAQAAESDSETESVASQPAPEPEARPADEETPAMESEAGEPEQAAAESVEEAPAAEQAEAETAEAEATEADGAETESADAVEADQQAAEAPQSAGVPGIDWYIIHTYSGFENKVKESLRTRADAFGFADRIGEILIPTEDVVEMRNGKKVTSRRLLYPGYVLLQLIMDDELWHVVKNTPRVTGFVGGDPSPTPLTADEVNQILFRQTASKEKPRPKMSFEHNDRVKIIDGPFTNFTGTVEEINPDRSTLKVMVTIFGRGTPVELEYFQVEKERI